MKNMIKKVLFLSLSLSFLWQTVKAQDSENTLSREQFLAEYIGTEDEPGSLVELFSRPVEIVNHYLYLKGEYRKSINIEHLSAYMRYYGSQARVEYCADPLIYDRQLDLSNRVPGNSVRSINGIFENPYVLFKELGNSNTDLKSELAIFQLCKFGYFSALFLNFDPAGINTAAWDLNLDRSRVDNICKPVTQTITKRLLERDSLFAENLDTEFLCRFDRD